MLLERIAVIGSPGSGKSTLARQLGSLLGLKVIHLDRHYWHPGWVPTGTPEWERVQRGLVRGGRWIIDGNYSRTMDIRLQAADTIIYLDFPRRLCLFRVLKRVFRRRFLGAERPDLPEGCPEHFDLGFLRWVWGYPRRSRPGTLARLAGLEGQKRIVHLRSPRALAQYLRTLRER